MKFNRVVDAIVKKFGLNRGETVGRLFEFSLHIGTSANAVNLRSEFGTEFGIDPDYIFELI